mmetsp:Transcript_500/g.1361  ORF Transcript_500/g.1361 Transcript_500/m.1361 type:complete len:160 (-) Transcript_500:125-604(-)
MFMLAGVLSFTGVSMIIQRGMHARKDFSSFFKGVPEDSLFSEARIHLGESLLAFWFAFTAAQALRFARSKRIVEHRAWIARHAASGLWVALMRLFIGVGATFLAVGTKVWGESFIKDGLWKNNLFYGTGVAAVVVCVGTAELYALALGATASKLPSNAR